MSSVPAMANLYRTVSLHVSDPGRYVSGLGRYDCKFHSHRYTGPYPNRRSNFPVRTGRYGTYRPIFGSMVPTMNGGYSKRAYVTFLVGNGDYVKGVVVLAKCLRKVKSAYPLVVAVMQDVPEDHRKALRCQGCVVHEIIEPVCPPESQIPIKRIHSEALYSKLCVWNDFLNIFLKHMFKPISVVYNLVLPILWYHPEIVELKKVKVVHYCAVGSKPWKYTGKEAYMDREDVKMLVAKWWDIYNDKLLDFNAEDSIQ